MGKLAERFTDVNRSGVYRVRAASVPRAAAAEARARLIEMPASAASGGGWPQLQDGLGAQDDAICVLLVSDAATLDAHAREQIVAALGAIARTRRAAGRAFFAVLIDPEGSLALPPLYHENPESAR